VGTTPHQSPFSPAILGMTPHMAPVLSLKMTTSPHTPSCCERVAALGMFARPRVESATASASCTPAYTEVPVARPVHMPVSSWSRSRERPLGPAGVLHRSQLPGP